MRTWIFIAALTTATTVAADDWMIQAGAYSKPVDAVFLSRLESLGPVVEEVRDDGTRVVGVGPFAEREEALAVLSGVRDVAADAYIRRVGGATLEAVQAAPAANKAGHATANTSLAEQLSQLDGLSPELRRRVVLLDGKLHVKEGADFTPLAQFLDNR